MYVQTKGEWAKCARYSPEEGAWQFVSMRAGLSLALLNTVLMVRGFGPNGQQPPVWQRCENWNSDWHFIDCMNDSCWTSFVKVRHFWNSNKSCGVAKCCCKPDNFILNSTGEIKLSKDTKYVNIHLREMCKKWCTSHVEYFILMEYAAIKFMKFWVGIFHSVSVNIM